MCGLNIQWKSTTKVCERVQIFQLFNGSSFLCHRLSVQAQTIKLRFANTDFCHIKRMGMSNTAKISFELFHLIVSTHDIFSIRSLLCCVGRGCYKINLVLPTELLCKYASLSLLVIRLHNIMRVKAVYSSLFHLELRCQGTASVQFRLVSWFNKNKFFCLFPEKYLVTFFQGVKE